MKEFPGLCVPNSQMRPLRQLYRRLITVARERKVYYTAVMNALECMF